MSKLKIKPEAVYICVMPFSVDVDGVPMTVGRDARLRGDHDAVRRFPQYFLEDGATDGERIAAYQALAGPPIVPDNAAAEIKVLEPMSGPDVVESTEDWQFGWELVPKGQRLRDSHPLVKQYPDCFKPVA